jgi:hypothetical protein
MGSAGALVVYSSTGATLWSSGTAKDPGSVLELQANGNLVIADGAATVWASKTGGAPAGGSQTPAAPAPASCAAPAPATPAPAPDPAPAPVVTTPVSTPIPQPTAHRRLAIRMTLTWTRDHATTSLRRVRIGTFPGRTEIETECLGRGCPRQSRATAKGIRDLRELLRRMPGHRYREGQRLLIALSAPGWLPEQIQLTFRDGRLPLVTLLDS